MLSCDYIGGLGKIDAKRHLVAPASSADHAREHDPKHIHDTHTKKQGRSMIHIYTRTTPKRSIPNARPYEKTLYTLLFGYRVYRYGVLHLDDSADAIRFFPLRLIFVPVRTVTTSLVSQLSCP